MWCALILFCLVLSMANAVFNGFRHSRLFPEAGSILLCVTFYVLFYVDSRGVRLLFPVKQKTKVDIRMSTSRGVHTTVTPYSS